MDLRAALLAFALFAVAHVKADGQGSETVEIREEKSSLFQASIVDHINSLNPGWTAGYNSRIHSLSPPEYKGLLGTFREEPEANGLFAPWKVRKHPKVDNLPDSFDARERWSQCSSTIGYIRDQGHCGSCWAFGAVEALSDRFCIHGNETVNLSANDIVGCCGILCGQGCNGGWPYKAWRYFMRKGVVTEKCDPYFDQEGCGHPGCSPGYPTPRCSRKCESDNEFWSSSKHYARDAYVVGPNQEEIKAELFLNGPLEVDFTVFEDFSYYKSGVYRHVYGGIAGGHAVKLVGWGTEDGDDYWLIANSWNEDWGENGYFKILRGVNECGIESDAVAGMPLLKAMSTASVLSI